MKDLKGGEAVSLEMAWGEPPDPVAVYREKQGRLPGGGELWAEEGGCVSQWPL